ncbi:MAG TPA: acyl-CoA dehydrogenase family protein [Nocardioidaceae bacterium]|nr:acyl-CoA dehydrogenase family protein [Nocardioidaceae bacterium]
MPTEQIYGLTPEQSDLFQLAREFGNEQLAPFALEWDLKKEFPVDVLRRAAELGMGGMYVGEDVGGSGLSRLEAALIVEGLAYGCPSIASYISIHNMVAGMIDRYGNDEQRNRWLPDLCSMAQLGSYCLTEAEAGSDAAALRTRADRDSDTYVLNGAKQFISGSGSSGIYVVMARTSADGARGISAFVVEDGTPGLSFGADEVKMGWNAQPTREVRFDDVRVPTDHRLDTEGMGFPIAMSGLDGGRVNIAASSLGGAQAAYDKALGYVEQRTAFGQKVAEFQATQFRIADMATELEASRLLLHRAARALDDGDPRATELCAMAKRHITDTCFDIANNALQLHGGYGYLHEYGIEKIVRDLRVHQILEGTNEIMRVIISRAQHAPKVAS